MQASGYMEQRHYLPTRQVHQHSYFQIVLPLKGALHLDIEGNALTLNTERGACIPPQMLHGFHADSSDQFLVLDLPASGRQAPQQLPLHTSFAIGPGARAFLDYLPSALRHQPDEQSRQHLGNLCLSLLADGDPAWLPTVLVRFYHCIHQQLDTPPKLETLARKLGLSARSLHRLCQQHWQRSPQQCWQYWRCQRAIAWLTQGVSVTETALHLGYQDTSNFSHFIRRETGHAPGHWQRRLELTQ
ncbi:AraC family transcriptional regulator [Pokkaliibacter sp. CJK22405]|uniref:AraC family transcriptional regulator n=1 Tax=Pokkaliibacter sp. CJK22405 TaxID=3384615 RepID=UPI00398475EF